MNLDRIQFKVTNDQLLILNQISELKKLNLVIKFDKSQYSTQTINTGSKVNALNLKNIEQFKGLKPFLVLDNNQLLDLYQIGVLEDFDKKDFKINVGDLVNYNNRNFIVLGVVVNTYAQWNLPTPLLFNPSGISNDVKSLYGSKLTDEEIVSKINDNFQKGKYDSDIIIPLVDMAKPKDIIKVVKPFVSEKESLDIFSKILKLKTADFKIEKDVFINTIADLKAQEIMSLKSTNEELYDKFNLVAKSINDIINKKIQDLPAQAKEKPERKPRAKKVVAPVIEKQLLTDLSNTKFWFGGQRELGIKVVYKAVELGWKRIKLNEDSDAIYFDANKEILESSSGRTFFDKEPEREIFYEDLFGKEMPKTTSVEPETKKDELPDSFDVVRTLVKDFPKGLYELTIYEALKQSTQTIAEIMNSKLIQAVDWKTTTDGADFWRKINDGDLTEFKQKYGAKGELAIKMFKDFMEKRELQEIKDKQEVLGVNLLFYPPVGSVVTFETDNLYELYDTTKYLLSKLKRDKLKLTFGVKTKDNIHNTKIDINSTISQDEFLNLLIEKFDTFVKPELVWSDFDAKLGDIDKIKENEYIINAFLDPKPVKVEKPKPVEVEKPTQMKVKRARAVIVDEKKTEEGKKTITKMMQQLKELEKPKPKATKIKATKPKVKDELSFLDDLDNIL
jgi:hypothetical protein